MTMVTSRAQLILIAIKKFARQLLQPRAIFSLVVWGLYCLLFIASYKRAGPALTAAATIPVVITAWLFGLRAGVATAVFAFPLNVLLINLAGGLGLSSMFERGLPGSLVLVISGAAIGRLHDLGEQVKAELAERKRTQEKLVIAEKMAALGRLTAGIAHEMNTPLATTLAGLAEVKKLIEEYQTALGDTSITLDDHRGIARDMGHAIQLAETAAERTASFVRGIKAQTRDMSPRERERFNAVPIIKDALNLLSHSLSDGHTTVTFECDTDYLELQGAPGRLAQVVTNLVTNGIDACAAHGGGKIIVRFTRGTAGLDLQVSDTGVGIRPEAMLKIFDPMFTTKPFGQGSGLGLTIVRDIITSDFGGVIDVTTQPDQGSTFAIHFPASESLNDTKI